MDMNRTVGQCLETYRTDLGLDQTQAACECNFEVSPQNIGRIERGLVKNPGFLTIMTLLKAYKKSFNDLETDMGLEVTPASSAATLVTWSITIPVIELEDVSRYVGGDDTVEFIDEITVKEKPRSRVFAIKIENEFMQSASGTSYTRGSVITFDPAKPFKNNKDMLVETPGGIIFRRVAKEASIFYLSTLNGSHPVMEIKEPLTTFGSVIESRLIS